MSVSPPKLMWEASLGKEMSVDGATLRFVALGKPDKTDDTVLGWYVLLSRPTGEAKILMKTFNYEPRLLKTFLGLRSCSATMCLIGHRSRYLLCLRSGFPTTSGRSWTKWTARQIKTKFQHSAPLEFLILSDRMVSLL